MKMKDDARAGGSAILIRKILDPDVGQLGMLALQELHPLAGDRHAVALANRIPLAGQARRLPTANAVVFDHACKIPVGADEVKRQPTLPGPVSRANG